MSYQLMAQLVSLLQEGNTAVVMAGNVKENLVVLRLSAGVEYRAELPADFAKTLPKEAFFLGTKWKFNAEGVYESIDAPKATPSKRGKGTGSNHKQQIGA